MNTLEQLLFYIPAGLLSLYLLALGMYVIRYQPDNQEGTFYKGDNLTEEQKQYNYLLMRYMTVEAKRNEIHNNNR